MPGSTACRQGSLHPPPWKPAGTAVVLAVVLAASTLCAQEVGSRPYTHVLVGLDPLTAYQVALDGETLLTEPVQTGAFGAVGFSIEGREGGTVVVAKPGPLGLTGARACSVSETVAVVCWYTDRPASSTVEFGLTSEYGLTAGPIGSAVTDHRVSLFPLTPATTYHFRVRSVDSLGRSATSGDYTLGTPPPADTSPPSIPGGLSAAPIPGGITLSWGAVGAPDLAGYGVWRRADGDAGFSRIAAVPPAATSMTDTDVTPGEMLEYAVAAFDHAGNESGLSGPVAVYPGVSGSPRMWVFPNPASTGATIRFTIPRNASHATRDEIGYDVRVYDARGRLVRTVCSGVTIEPVVTVHWDTTGANRRIVGSGIYFCVVSLPGRKIRSKVMVLR